MGGGGFFVIVIRYKFDTTTHAHFCKNKAVTLHIVRKNVAFIVSRVSSLSYLKKFPTKNAYVVDDNM